MYEFHTADRFFGEDRQKLRGESLWIPADNHLDVM